MSRYQDEEFWFDYVKDRYYEEGPTEWACPNCGALWKDEKDGATCPCLEDEK